MCCYPDKYRRLDISLLDGFSANYALDATCYEDDSEKMIPRTIVMLALLSKVAMAPCIANAQTADPRNGSSELQYYDISEQLAENALSLLSEQIDMPLIYSMEEIEGMQVNAVKGMYTEKQALLAMVDNTELQLIQDMESGIWVIKRRETFQESDVEVGSIDNDQSLAIENMTTTQVRQNTVFTRLMNGLTALILAGASTTAVAQDDDEEDEIFFMSPFVIDASEDTGYTAQSTLAGTRIRTEVRELGSSITILTDKFLEDTGATDALTLLTYTANTEVGGVLGNFSAGSDGSGRFTTNNTRRNPQNGQRVRGLSRAELTRDYFSTVIPFDQYNTTRVTLNRGPNSVLFGIGSPGGVIDHSLKQAIQNEAITEVKFRFDHRGSTRGSFDVNRSIIEDRLAIRVAGLYDKLKYQQEPAEEEDQRLFVAFEGVLFENENSDFLGQTTVRGHIEFGEIDRNPPDVIPPIDAFRFWFDGYTDVDSLLAVPGVELSDLGRNMLSPQQSPDGRFIPQVTYDSINRQGHLNTKTRTASFINIPLYYESGNATTPGWSDPALAGLSGGMSRIRWPGSSGRPRQDHLFSGNAIRDLVGFTGYSLQNRDIFDYRNNLFQGTMNNVNDKFNVQQFVIDQTFLDGRAGIELSYNRQDSDKSSLLPLSSGLDKELYIDITETVSNDVPNPNLGRPVVRINRIDTQYSSVEQETVRATAFVDVDIREFSETLGTWLGRHTLTALFEQRDTDDSDYTSNLAWDSDTIDVVSNESFGATANSGRRAVTHLVYLGPSVLGAGNFNDVRITDSVNVPLPQVGDRHTAWYWDHTARERKVGEFFVEDYITDADLERRELTSEAFALKSSFLDDHIVTILAWRKDQEKAYERLTQTGTFSGDLPLRNPDGSINADIIRLNDEASADVTDETLTTSIVGFFPEKYLFELPLGMDLSFHYYEAESFQPAGFSQNIIGEPVAAPVGETTEYGFSLDFLDRRLSLRVNLYETSNANNRTTVQGTINNATNRIGDWLANFRGARDQGIAFSDLGVPTGTATSYDEIFETIINLIPEPTRSLRNYGFGGPNGGVTSDQIENLTSTFDFVSDGMEIELVGSPLPNWSISLNVAKQETVRSNTAPALSDVVFAIEQNIIDSGLANVADAPNLGVDITFLERYQNVVSFPVRAELANDGRKSLEQREWRVNLVTNYDFLDGPVKGFSVGGAIRWQDEAAIGYPLLLDEGGNQIPDLDNAYFGDDELNGDIWFSYRRKLFEEKVDWRIQLNIRNAIRSDSDIPVFANPNGEIAVFRIPPEQSLFITNTFRF